MTTEDSDKHHGQLVKSLFDQCVDLDPEAQKQTLMTSELPETVVQHVRELLACSTDDMALTQSVIDSVQVSLDIKPLMAGLQIGAYELREPLGRGGQGEVWRASRTEGDFQHQVAIKFLKPVHDDTELFRFQSEREVLAQLKHPNIAQLLDGGEFENQRPYMVIELVEGMSIIEFTTTKQYSLEQYLRCFLQICDAISYAHSHSVIHRDIKPSNVLMTHEGKVKILDFGIAKLIDSDQQDTQTAPMVTMAYSSPEQLSGGTISTATDVYALGLVLYELLTGERAQAYNTEVPTEMIHEITENMPKRPSQVLFHESSKRAFSGKQLQGDLDNLILMALRKEPERRYRTAEALARDVRNFLDGKPLTATGDGWWYASKKAIQRNPVTSFMALALFTVLAILPSLLLQKQAEITTERDRALLAQKQAEEQRLLAQRNNQFLVDVLQSASPLASKGEDVKLKDVLLMAERQLFSGLDDQPHLKADLLSDLASIQHSLGEQDKSHQFYSKALEMYQQSGDLEGELLGLGRLANAEYFRENSNAVKTIMEEAHEKAKNVQDPVTLGWHQAYMATLSNFLGDHAYTRSNLPGVIAELEAGNPEENQLIGRLYNELSLAYTHDDFNNEKALLTINKAVDNAAKTYGELHPNYVSRLINKGTILSALARTREAEEVRLSVKAIAEKIYTPNHPVTAQIIGELALGYHDQGRFSETEKLYLQGIEINKNLSGEKSLNYVVQLNNLAFLYEDMGRYDESEATYRQSLAIRRELFSGIPRRVVSTASNLARLLTRLGKSEEARELMTEVKALDDGSKLKYRVIDLALLIGTLGDACELNQTPFTDVLTEIEALPGAHWRRMHGELRMGELALACGDRQAAQSLLEAAKDKAQQIYAPGSDGVLLVQNKVRELLAPNQ